jgi:hypothetical protein
MDDRLVRANLAHLLRLSGCCDRDDHYGPSDRLANIHWRTIPFVFFCYSHHDSGTVVSRGDFACGLSRHNRWDFQYLLLLRLYPCDVVCLRLSQASGKSSVRWIYATRVDLSTPYCLYKGPKGPFTVEEVQELINLSIEPYTYYLAAD